MRTLASDAGSFDGGPSRPPPPASVDSVAVLPNGLRLVHAPDPHSPTVTVSVWFRTGSRSQAVPGSGTVHLLEHLMLTADAGHRCVSDAIEDLGGECAGGTAYECQHLLARVPAEHAEQAVALLAQAPLLPGLDGAEIEVDLERERAAVLNEIAERRRSTKLVLHDLVFAARPVRPPLGPSPAGETRLVAACTRDTLLAEHRERLSGTGIGVLVVGPVEPARVCDWLAHSPLADLPARPDRSLAAPATAGQPDRGADPTGAARSSGPAGPISALAGPAPALGSADRIAGEVLARVLAGGSRALADIELRQRRGLAYTVAAEAHPFTDCGTLLLWAPHAAERAAEMRAALRTFADRLPDQLTDDVVRRAGHWAALTFADLSSDQYSLSMFAGRLVLLTGAARWCPQEDAAAARGADPAEVRAVAAAFAAAAETVTVGPDA